MSTSRSSTSTKRELASKPRNVRGLLFEEEEAGYLVGYLAGLVTKHEAGSKQVIGSVGGHEDPAASTATSPATGRARDGRTRRCVTLNGTPRTSSTRRSARRSRSTRWRGARRIVFQVAGQCGLGVLDAAAEQDLYGIGVDTDQCYLGAHVLTSALKRVDVAVFQTIQAEQEGTFAGGENTVFDLASGGVGIGEIAPDVPAEIVSRVHAIEDDDRRRRDHEHPRNGPLARLGRRLAGACSR